VTSTRVYVLDLVAEVTATADWTAPGQLTAQAYRLDLPWGRPPLSLNDRRHRLAKIPVIREVRTTAGWLARTARIPSSTHVTVTLVYQPGPRGRASDADNWVATLKPLCDGLVDAAVVPDDTPEWMTKTMPQVLPRSRSGPHCWLIVTTTP